MNSSRYKHDCNFSGSCYIRANTTLIQILIDYYGKGMHFSLNRPSIQITPPDDRTTELNMDSKLFLHKPRHSSEVFQTYSVNVLNGISSICDGILGIKPTLSIHCIICFQIILGMSHVTSSVLSYEIYR